MEGKTMPQKPKKFIKSIPFGSVQIGGFSFDVEYPWKEPDPGLKAQVSHKMQRIAIEKGTHDNLRESLLHEIHHVLEDQCAIKLEEEEVRRFTHAWYAFIKQNPNVIRWILEN